jgi:hypothetical protein
MQGRKLNQTTDSIGARVFLAPKLEQKFAGCEKNGTPRAKDGNGT